MNMWAVGNNLMFDAMFICLRVKMWHQYLWKRFRKVVKKGADGKTQTRKINKFWFANSRKR